MANTQDLIGPEEKIPLHLPIFRRTSEMLAFIPDIQLFSESNQMVKTDQQYSPALEESNKKLSLI